MLTFSFNLRHVIKVCIISFRHENNKRNDSYLIRSVDKRKQRSEIFLTLISYGTSKLHSNANVDQFITVKPREREKNYFSLQLSKNYSIWPSALKNCYKCQWKHYKKHVRWFFRMQVWNPETQKHFWTYFSFRYSTGLSSRTWSKKHWRLGLKNPQFTS